MLSRFWYENAEFGGYDDSVRTPGIDQRPQASACLDHYTGAWYNNLNAIQRCVKSIPAPQRGDRCSSHRLRAKSTHSCKPVTQRRKMEQVEWEADGLLLQRAAYTLWRTPIFPSLNAAAECRLARRFTGKKRRHIHGESAPTQCRYSISPWAN